MKIDNERALAMYRQGMNDTDMAKIFRCYPNYVCKWRARRKLPNNHCNRIDHARALELYHAGYSDSAMARLMMVTHQAVWHWRKTHDFSANRKYVKRKKQS